MRRRDRLVTAGEKTELCIEAERPQTAPGRLAFLRVRYTDENGVTKPSERGMLQASVEGGTLEAFGSACPYHERSCLDAESDTYYGEALLLIRAGERGTMIASVSDGSLSASAAVTIL